MNGAVFKTVCEIVRAISGWFDSDTPPPILIKQQNFYCENDLQSMNGEPFFKGIEAVGKVIVAAIVGALIMALALLGLGLMDDYYTNHNIRTFAPAMGAILGFLLGGVTGGFVGIIHPNPRNAFYTAIIISTIFVLILLTLKFQYFSILESEGSYSMVYSDIIFLIGSGIAFILSIWIPAKIVSSL